jgi:stress-induced morphogen
MQRVLDHYLTIWQQDPTRTSMLIRGARQVGKTFTVRKFAEAFTDLVTVAEHRRVRRELEETWSRCALRTKHSTVRFRGALRRVAVDTRNPRDVQ